MLKKILALLTFIIVVASLWFAFALWAGIYSMYSIAPSKEHPDGSTLIVSRDEWEPMFNSAEYKPPKKPDSGPGGISFEKTVTRKRPLETRTILTLPYIDWAYRKSLEPQSSR
jgi:hypothetical protein